MYAAAVIVHVNNRSLQRYVAEFLDVRTQKWAAFAAVWNEVINQMRLSDVISNAERDMLKFHSFTNASKPVYLPIFQTAGCVERAVAVMVDEVSTYTYTLQQFIHSSYMYMLHVLFVSRNWLRAFLKHMLYTKSCVIISYLYHNAVCTLHHYDSST